MKPSWDEYYIDMAYIVAQRSIDPSTKCGCVVIADDHAVLSVGYNSPPRNCRDDKIPLTRPEKYPFFVHAEENAYLNAARKGIALEGSTFYITAVPCSRCFRGMLGVGAKKIIHGPNAAHVCDEKDLEVIRLLNEGSDGKPQIEIISYVGKIGKVIFENTKLYMENKYGSCIIDTEKDYAINHKE